MVNGQQAKTTSKKQGRAKVVTATARTASITKRSVEKSGMTEAVVTEIVRNVTKALKENPNAGEAVAKQFGRAVWREASRASIQSDEMIETNIRESLRKRIIGLRESLGMKQAELARRCGLVQSYIWQIENGNRTPTLLVLSKIAASLGVSLTELVSVCDKAA